eukprot:659950_1
MEFEFPMVAGLQLPTFVAIVYFCAYFVSLILLAVYVWIKEEHHLNTTFLKSIWAQWSIYGQVIVHFYDTATDLGVVILWYGLYKDEMDGIDYPGVVILWYGLYKDEMDGIDYPGV